jgi:hypothetical protein
MLEQNSSLVSKFIKIKLLLLRVAEHQVSWQVSKKPSGATSDRLFRKQLAAKSSGGYLLAFADQ